MLQIFFDFSSKIAKFRLIIPVTTNCGIKVNGTGAHDFVAIKDISVNEEITFDYAMRNYIIDYFPKKCMCGSKRCRGRVTGWKDLPDEKKKEYEGFAAPYLLELGAKHSCEKV